MSVQFLVHTSRGMIKGLEKIIRDWASTHQNQTGVRIVVSSFTSPNQYYIFGEGSIRGISLTPSSTLLKGGRINVRLSVMASREDWKFCYSLLRTLSLDQHVKIFDDNGEMIPANILTDVSAFERGSKTFQSDCKFLRHVFSTNDEPKSELPTPWFDLVVTREDLAETNSSGNDFLKLENKLVEMAALFGFCRHANQILMKDGLTLNAIGFEPTIYQETDYAALIKKNSLGLPFDEAEQSFVKFKDFLDIFQNKIEQVKERPACYYFSGINPENNQELDLYEKLTILGQDELPKKY